MHALDTATVGYEDDLHAWSLEQASLLRARRADLIDWDHLAEEIEGMAGRDRRELKSRLRVLLYHLLKWQGQPGLRCGSWRATIMSQRAELADLLEESPSLRRFLADYVQRVYGRARQDALDETGLFEPAFPETCPYSAEQVLAEDFLPDA